MYGDAFISSIVLYAIYIIVLTSFDEVPDLCGIVDTSAYELSMFVLLPTPRRLNNSLPTPRNRHLTPLGNNVA